MDLDSDRAESAASSTERPTRGAAYLGMTPSDSVPSRPAQQLYRWVDDQGVANWTNNGQAVPQRYRSQAQ